VMLPERTAAILAEYVRGGGALVAEARLAWNNERGFASERIPGGGLWEVMGARETAIETAPGGRTTLRWTGSDLPGFAAGAVLPARWYKETLQPLAAAATVVAEFADGAPAAVMSTYGKGRTLMLGSFVSAAAQSTPTPEAERFFAGLLEWAGVALPVRVTGAPLEARHLDSGRDALLFLFNHGRQPAKSEVWLECAQGEYGAEDLMTGRVVPVRRAGTGVTIDVDIAPSAVQVLRISTR
jgi:beta-galactosidase